MADQKNVSKQRGKKGSGKKQVDSGSSSKAGRSSKRRVMNYWSRNRKYHNSQCNLAKQRENKAHANRPGRTKRGQARAMRRASVIMATSAIRNLAEVERQLRVSSPKERRTEDAQEKLIQIIFGVDADGNKLPSSSDSLEQTG